MINADLIDAQVFDELYASIGEDPAFLGELLDTYFADAPRLIAAMSAALAVDNAAEFRRAAHSLKSNSASFGARHLAALCRELEEMGKAGVLTGAADRLPAVEAECAAIQTALAAKREALTR